MPDLIPLLGINPASISFFNNKKHFQISIFLVLTSQAQRPYPKHEKVFSSRIMSEEQLQVLNNLPCTCGLVLPPTMDPASTLPEIPTNNPNPNTRQGGVPNGHFTPYSQVFK